MKNLFDKQSFVIYVGGVVGSVYVVADFLVTQQMYPEAECKRGEAFTTMWQTLPLSGLL